MDIYARLLGREQELGVLRRMFRASAGVPPVVVVRGEPGIGKSSLLECCTALRPPSALVLQAGGVASESRVRYGGLHRLLCGAFPWASTVTDVQRAALRIAFGVDDGPAPDPLLVGRAALSVLTGAAADRHVLCIVDDAHLVDGASIDALAFVARRLRADRVAVVFAEPQADPVAALGAFPALHLGGLAPRASAALLDRALGSPLAPDLAARLLPHTAGNPLAIAELAAGQDHDRLARFAVLPCPPPTGARIRDRFGPGPRASTDRGAPLELLVAADRRLELWALVAAAARLGIDPSAIDEAERAGRIEIEGDAVVFGHPLVRAACYWSAAPSARRRAHEVLASLIDPAHDPERHGWHLALSAIEPDEQISWHLALAARRAGERGAGRSQVELLLRSAELAPDPTARIRRHLRAAVAAGMVGDGDRLERLASRARDGASDGYLLAEIDRIEAVAPVFQHRHGLAAQRLARSARSLDQYDRARAREVALEAFVMFAIADASGDGGAQREFARTVRELPRAVDAGEPSGTDLLLDGYAAVLLDGWEVGGPLLREARSRWGAVAGSQAAGALPLGEPVCTTFALWDHDTADEPDLEALVPGRHIGALEPVRLALVHRARRQTARGDYAGAEASSAEIAERSLARCDHPGWGAIGAAEALAWRGRTDEAQHAIEQLVALARDQEFGYAQHLAHVVAAILANGARRYAEAAAAAGRVAGNPASAFGSQALVELAEALVHLGRTDALDEVLREIDVRACVGGSALARGMSARAHALAAVGDDADARYRRSIDLLARTAAPAEHARAHLVYGEWLRREKRLVDARRHLGEAHRLLVQLGVDGFASRARSELRAAGGRAARQDRSATDLTAQELQVAQLAGEGHTNKEIAVRLYLSASTVDFHLRKVFRKLGITSRRQLAAGLGAAAGLGPDGVEPTVERRDLVDADH